jgi:tripartite-type tricarboxylate transporter receptor subunit TctC
VLPGYEAYEWHGLLLPAGVPAATIASLHKALVEVMAEDEVKQRFVDMGTQPVGSTPAEFGAFLKKEDAKWAEVVHKGGIKLD